MKIIYNRVIPIKGFACINLFGVLFVRKGKELSPTRLNHEAIHTAQMQELGYVLFYVLYVLEWFYRLIFHTRTAYRGISFEREAYANADNPDYLLTRRRFAQWQKNESS